MTIHEIITCALVVIVTMQSFGLAQLSRIVQECFEIIKIIKEQTK